MFGIINYKRNQRKQTKQPIIINKTSIIIPTTGRKSLLNSYNSARNQTAPVQIFIVWDCPKEIFEQQSKDYPDCTCLWSGHCKNAGETRNVALEKIDTDYVAFLDDDDFLPTDYISKMLDATTNGATLVRAAYLQWEGRGDYYVLGQPERVAVKGQRFGLGNPLSNFGELSNIGFMVRTDFIRKHNLKFVSTKAEDFIFIVKCAELEAKIELAMTAYVMCGKGNWNETCRC